MHQLHPHLTTWHITWGTHGARIHGDDRLTVDTSHNQSGEEFVERNESRVASARGRMNHPPVILTIAQRQFIESNTPSICERGGWILRTCAAGPDHVHVLLDIDPTVHGEKVRRLLKRWIGQSLNEQWPQPRGASWWAEEGSNRAVHDEAYLHNALRYVHDQRTTREVSATRDGAEDGPARFP